MISSEVSNILNYRLRKLAQSGLPAHELASTVQQLLEAERSQKMTANESQQDFMLPFFSGRKVHLNLV